MPSQHLILSEKEKKALAIKSTPSWTLNLSLTAAEFHHLGLVKKASLNFTLCVLQSVMN